MDIQFGKIVSRSAVVEVKKALTDAFKVVSSMALVFFALAITGPLAYGLQNLDQLF